jgi:thioredoxin
MTALAACSETAQSTNNSPATAPSANQTAKPNAVKAPEQKPMEIKMLDDSNFRTILKDAKTIVVVDFYADWCGPCKAVKPLIEKLAKEYEGRIVVVKVNIEKAPTVSKEEGIRSIPTVMVFSSEGKTMLESLAGARPYREYKELVERHLAKQENGTTAVSPVATTPSAPDKK